MARRRPSKGTPGPKPGESPASYVARNPGGVIARWQAEGPLPDWFRIGSYEEWGAGLICGDELPGRLAANHRRRRGGHDAPE
jgi:hypothetical protein